MRIFSKRTDCALILTHSSRPLSLACLRIVSDMDEITFSPSGIVLVYTSISGC